MITTDRITVGHLKRNAYLYVRQSTLYQTEQNPESLDCQYDFRKQALSLGWHEDQIVTLDEDLGQSGAEATHRPDFQRLVADVGLGQVGVVLSLEVFATGPQLRGLAPSAGIVCDDGHLDPRRGRPV